ncbi:MAG: undecaprenyldiphospho-muramoylpentapeptide beta-N-acetylglucosaminyltransferase [Candidatus Electryoneaceae bacterium]|nr:undecaprenyldiphospho-muramoylpentapeptide beta-N-acetylglucosaminyltransferase [Candidatus Electryoneaceae bacterium]
MKKRIRLVVSGGGTGGHITPALAICRAIKDRYPHFDILYIGSRSGPEKKSARQAGYPFRSVWISSLERGNIIQNIGLLPKIIVSILQAVCYLLRYNVKLVIGTGGYASWSVCIAAKLLFKPYVLQEQNAFPGLVNCMLTPGAKRIYLGYDEARRKLHAKQKQFLFTGNPIEFTTQLIDKSTARQQFGLVPNRRTIFVTGGSGGALTINGVLDQCNERLIRDGFNIIWQTGKNIGELSLAVPEQFKHNLLIVTSFNRDQMMHAYSAADIVVARAGAMTLAELGVMGLPAILIPYPYAAGDHQKANARYVESAGGAVMILNEDLTSETLLSAVRKISAPQTGTSMARAMRDLARTDAADVIAVDIVEEVLKY